jgi:hypothetical protein
LSMVSNSLNFRCLSLPDVARGCLNLRKPATYELPQGSTVRTDGRTTDWTA